MAPAEAISLWLLPVVLVLGFAVWFGVLRGKTLRRQTGHLAWVCVQMAAVQGALAWVVIRGMLLASAPPAGGPVLDQVLDMLVWCIRGWAWLIAFFGFGMWRTARFLGAAYSPGLGEPSAAMIGAEVSIGMAVVTVMVGAFASLVAQGMSAMR